MQVLCIDCTSLGDPVYERIEAMIGGTITCIPFRFSSMTKSNLYKYYLQELHSGRIKYAAGPATQRRHEFTKFTTEHLDLDREDYGGYAICRAPQGGHDDYPDSAALATWAEKVADEHVMPDIVVTSASGNGGGASRRGERMEEAGTEKEAVRSFLELAAASASGARAGRYQRRR